MPAEILKTPFVGLIVLLAVVLVVIRFARGAPRTTAGSTAHAKPLLSARELDFMRTLDAALGDAAVHVCPQASIDEFVRFTGPEAFAARGRYRARRSDFVLMDRAARVILAIEVDDPSHDAKRDADRHRDATLTQAGIPTLRIPKGRLPDAAALRSRLRELSPEIRP